MEKSDLHEISADKFVEALAKTLSLDELADALKGHKIAVSANTIEQIKNTLGPIADPIFDQPPRSGNPRPSSGGNLI